jgi:hypothetical protein
MTTTTLLTDIAERFALGSPRGFAPTTEPVSDTATTPFGLTLRTTPDPGNVAVVRNAVGELVMATEKATVINDDGQTGDDVRADVIDD